MADQPWRPDSEPWSPEEDRPSEEQMHRAHIRYHHPASGSKIDGDFPASFILVIKEKEDGDDGLNFFTSLVTPPGQRDMATKLIMKGILTHFLKVGFTPQMLSGFIEALAISMPTDTTFVSHDEMRRRREEGG